MPSRRTAYFTLAPYLGTGQFCYPADLPKNRANHLPAVESQMLSLGTQAPAFTLPDPDGKLHSLREGAQAYRATGYGV